MQQKKKTHNLFVIIILINAVCIQANSISTRINPKSDWKNMFY